MTTQIKFFQAIARYGTDTDRKEIRVWEEMLSKKPRRITKHKNNYVVAIRGSVSYRGEVSAYSPDQALSTFVRSYLKTNGAMAIWLNGETKIFYLSSFGVMVSQLLKNKSLYAIEMKI